MVFRNCSLKRLTCVVETNASHCITLFYCVLNMIANLIVDVMVRRISGKLESSTDQIYHHGVLIRHQEGSLVSPLERADAVGDG